MVDGKKNIKRGRQAPSFPLARAIDMLEQIQTNLGEGPFSRDSIAEALGYKSASGSVNVRVGTLTHYGLLGRTKGGAYTLSSIGKRILMPESEQDKHKAVAEAAASPTLYAEIISEFTGQAIPNMFGNILVHKFNVLPKQREDVAELFRDAMLYAGLLRQGVLHSEPLPIQQTNNDENGELDETEIEVVTKREAVSTPQSRATSLPRQGDYQEYTVPLDRSGKVAHLYLPTPVRVSYLRQVEKWAKFMATIDEVDGAEESTDSEGNDEA